MAARRRSSSIIQLPADMVGPYQMASLRHLILDDALARETGCRQKRERRKAFPSFSPLHLETRSQGGQRRKPFPRKAFPFSPASRENSALCDSKLTSGRLAKSQLHGPSSLKQATTTLMLDAKRTVFNCVTSSDTASASASLVLLIELTYHQPT